MEEQNLKTIGKGALFLGGAIGLILLGAFLYFFLIALVVIIWIALEN